jgi:hypothetical protein
MRNLFNFGVNRVMLETLISILFMLRQILVSDLEHLASLKKKNLLSNRLPILLKNLASMNSNTSTTY